MAITNFQPISRNQIKSGLINFGAVSENVYPDDAVLESLNFNFDTIGKMTLRKGTTLLGNSPGSSSSSGTLSPGTMADDSAVGTETWSDLNNAKVEDGNSATVVLNNQTSHYLKATNLGFSIPAGATINGILVEIKKKQVIDGNYIKDNAVKIVKADGSIGTTNKADTINYWTGTLLYSSYGGVSDLWGGTWTSADINNANFGAVISAIGITSACTTYIDNIRITVYFSFTTNGGTLGLYNFRDSGAGTNNQLLMVNGTTVYYLATATWTSKRTVTTGLKARFSTFLDFVFMVNGTDATAIWDGNPSNSFLTTGNALNAPTGKFIDNFRARIWIAGNSTYPDRVYYSSIPSAVTTPIITWDTNVTTGQWIDISPSDGENITALHRTKGALLVFKNNHLYRVFSIQSADPDPQFNVGTYSQESVVETKNGVYFHHPTGFYRYDGNVTEISRPIIDIVRAITLTNYSKVSGYVEADGDHVCWSVGNCTVNGVDYANLVVRYTISTQLWTHYSYPSQFLVGTSYNNGTNVVTVVGDNGGKVFTTETGLTDNGSELMYSIIHPLDDIDGSHATLKIVNKMFFMHSRMTGANINYQTPEDVLNDFRKSVGQMKSSETGFSNLALKGRKLKFKLSGFSRGNIISYEGYQAWGTTQDINFT